jgi:PAS domain S-box-containing protein
VFTGGGEMADRLRAFDWEASPLGTPDQWPHVLRSAVGICLHSSVPTAIYWGPELRLLYNDAWAPIPGERHPGAIGMPAAEVWSDIWPVVGPQLERVVSTGRGFSTFDQMLPIKRGGLIEESYWTYSFTPILGEDDRFGGVFNQGSETTERVQASRSQSFMLELGDRLRDLAAGDADPRLVLYTALEALGVHVGASRAGYAELDPTGDWCSVVENWRVPGAANLAAGRYRLSSFGDVTAQEILAGRTLAIDDAEADPRVSSAAAASFATLGIRANLVTPVIRNGRAIAFLFLNGDAPRRWGRHQIDLAREVVERVWHALERARAAKRLRESEARFAAIFGQAAVGLSEIDLHGRFIRSNDSMERMLGRSPQGLSFSEATHPEEAAENRRLFGHAAETGEPFTMEHRFVRPDGSQIWASSNVTRLVDERGRPSGMFAVTADVTQRREEEKLRGLLLLELNHRVKNNIATVQALARQTQLATNSPAEFQQAFDARLMALSRAHDLLMRETWTTAPLGDIVAGTLAPYAAGSGTRIAVEGPDVQLSPTAAVTLSIAVHELASNAAKFGSLSDPDGRVSVRWSVERTEQGGTVTLEWRESGGPAVTPPKRRGFGARLIERGAMREFGGEAQLSFQPEGVVCIFHLPLSKKIMAP